VQVEVIIEEVLKRLFLPRVAFLWWEETLPPFEIRGGAINIIHYFAGSPLLLKYPAHLKPLYFLTDLDDLEKEARSLDMIVIPKAKAYLIQDILSGMPITKEGMFLSYCIDFEVTVILDLSEVRSLYKWKGKMKRLIEKSMDILRDMGVVLIDASTEDTTELDREATTLLLENEGWISWREIANLLTPHVKNIILKGNTNLSPEAWSRLEREGIRIAKEG